jgi:hypothetical protein
MGKPVLIFREEAR